MKKRIMAASLAMCAVMLTACAGDTNSQSAPSSSQTSSAAESSTTSESSSSSVESSSSETPSSSESSSSSEAPIQSSEESSDTSSDEPAPPPASGAKAKAYADAAYNCGLEWESASELTDGEALEFMIWISADDLEDWAAYIPMMSAHVKRIFVGKPKAGKEADVEAKLAEYAEYTANPMNGYPTWEEDLSGMIRGKTSDGYLYLIIHQDASQAEQALKAV